MMRDENIQASNVAWENGDLGADENYAATVDTATENSIDEAACSHLISIRMQKGLVEDLKLIAALNKGIGYQTLMKQILQHP